MDLKEYFEHTAGTGVLSTSHADGRVDAAIYSRPHFMEDGTVAFIMRDRRSHEYLTSNPRAAFLFIEKGEGHRGIRLYLLMTGEEKNAARIDEIRRRSRHPEKTEGDRFLVYFSIEEERPLVGG